jgi:hypothetical protein
MRLDDIAISEVGSCPCTCRRRERSGVQIITSCGNFTLGGWHSFSSGVYLGICRSLFFEGKKTPLHVGNS